GSCLKTARIEEPSRTAKHTLHFCFLSGFDSIRSLSAGMEVGIEGLDSDVSILKKVKHDEDPVPSTSMTASLSNLAPMVPQVLSTGAEILENPCLPMNKGKDVASSSSTVHQNPVPSSAKNKEEVAENELKKKFEEFKLFDTVDDVSDHHFNCAGFQGQQPSRSWTKKIQDEWKILEKDLPDTIFVRAYETRMDLLRAVIIGPAGTPYHDGLFVFDVHFPPNYPDIPPHFEDLVGGHFRSRAHCILLACKAYMEGAPVGSITDEKIPNEKSGSKSFKAAVAKLMNGLISNFSRYGVTNCDQYRV
ncbi:Ubiquitin-conjugating enzyme, E2, partial [Cynara cardunculus var. scolymus]